MVVGMARSLRGVEDGGYYHVLNRGNGRMMLFCKPEDFAAFCKAGKRYQDGMALPEDRSW